MEAHNEHERQAGAGQLERIVRRGLDFAQALVLLKQGKRVRRAGWAQTVKSNRKLSIELTSENKFYVRYTGYQTKRVMFPAYDVLAVDWEEASA